MKNINNNKYLAIGLMSGTSLDGLDVVVVQFQKKESLWDFEVIASDCIVYSPTSKDKLKKAHTWNGPELSQLHADYGKWIGKVVVEFIANNGIQQAVDVIGSHGHTILHNPEQGYTLQIGSGADIAAITNIPVVSDLRSNDIAAGGQGAPIVPIGEKLLFADHNAFLNIGGITNIAFHNGDEVRAYDICPGNTPLNLMIQDLGFEYDKGGLFASKGKIDKTLLTELNDFSFYNKTPPRSLHTDIIVNEFMPIINRSKSIVADKLATVIEHIAIQVGESLKQFVPEFSVDKLMITGGGAFNSFLLERIRANTAIEIVVPNDEVVKYKEAIVMALFSVLRLRKEVNCLSSVTGANKNVVGGALYIS